MATYTLGKIGMNLRGTYDASATYNKLDVVTYNGSSYAALQCCTGIPVTNTEYWQMLCAGNAESYSTDEVCTGSTWVDGKLIYRKVFNVTGNPIQLLDSYYYTFPAIEGIDVPISMRGYWKRSKQDGVGYMSIPFAMETDLHYWVTVSLNTSGNPYLRFSYPYSDIIHIVLIMEYTKED